MQVLEFSRAQKAAKKTAEKMDARAAARAGDRLTAALLSASQAGEPRRHRRMSSLTPSQTSSAANGGLLTFSPASPSSKPPRVHPHTGGHGTTKGTARRPTHSSRKQHNVA